MSSYTGAATVRTTDGTEHSVTVRVAVTPRSWSGQIVDTPKPLMNLNEGTLVLPDGTTSTFIKTNGHMRVTAAGPSGWVIDIAGGEFE